MAIDELTMNDLFQFDLSKLSRRCSSSVNSSAVTPKSPLPSARRVSRTSSAVSAASSAEDPPLTARSSNFLPHAATQLTKARRIRLYRNGDTFYAGMVVVIAPERFRTFDSLLSYVNKTALADPSVLKRVSSAVPLLFLCL